METTFGLQGAITQKIVLINGQCNGDIFSGHQAVQESTSLRHNLSPSSGKYDIRCRVKSRVAEEKRALYVQLFNYGFLKFGIKFL